jgi:hypothetical protein
LVELRAFLFTEIMRTDYNIKYAPFGDVPIKFAAIGWNETRPSPMEQYGYERGKIVIIPINLNREGKIDYWRRLRLGNSTGAVFCEWGNWTNKQRLLKLYIEAWHIVCRDGLNPKDVHEAFMVIPEYRESLSGEMFFNELVEI